MKTKTSRDSWDSQSGTDTKNIGISWAPPLQPLQSPRQMGSARQSIFRTHEEANEEREQLRALSLSTDAKNEKQQQNVDITAEIDV